MGAAFGRCARLTPRPLYPAAVAGPPLPPCPPLSALSAASQGRTGGVELEIPPVHIPHRPAIDQDPIPLLFQGVDQHRFTGLQDPNDRSVGTRRDRTLTQPWRSAAAASRSRPREVARAMALVPPGAGSPGPGGILRCPVAPQGLFRYWVERELTVSSRRSRWAAAPCWPASTRPDAGPARPRQPPPEPESPGRRRPSARAAAAWGPPVRRRCAWPAGSGSPDRNAGTGSRH